VIQDWGNFLEDVKRLTLQVACKRTSGNGEYLAMQQNTNLPTGTGTLWKVDEAAAFLNISAGTLYHWVSQKRIPCMHFGSRCLRFDPQQVKQWAAAFDESGSRHK
jgi:excisionase family DNA binding protein